MKIRRIFSVFLLSILLATLFLTPQAYALEEPTLDARNALLMDETNGRMLYGKAEKEKAYPASITKVMTALLVLEAVDRGDLSVSQPITASYEAANSIDEDSSTAGIEEGEVLTVEQLLYCLLVVSANEAANILAEAVSGSVTDFVALMNQRAAELGCEGTHFANTNGLPDPDHYTTAWDIYLIAREAMKHDLFMTICGSKSYAETLAAAGEGTLERMHDQYNLTVLFYSHVLLSHNHWTASDQFGNIHLQSVWKQPMFCQIQRQYDFL